MIVRTIAYWVTTGLFSLGMGMSAAVYLSQQPFAIDAMTNHLGFPAYTLYILGIAKGLGAIALLTPAFPKLKEWAYAGFTFNLIGAVWAHVAVGDPVTELIGPTVLFGIMLASYFLRPKSLKVQAVPAA
ncbi:MAG: DoxX family protein [Myxococcota bacterium]